MKIAQLMTGSSIDLENRKRALQRRDMGEAYKKTQQYQSAKNPMLEALENLLSGKTEKELHTADQVKREFDGFANDGSKSYKEIKEEELKSPQVQAEIKNVELTEKEVTTYENAHKAVGGDVTGAVSSTYTDGPDNKRYIDDGEVSIHASEGSTPGETLSILERVKAAALAPADPSPQDLRVAAGATAQIQQTRAVITGERYEELTGADEDPFANLDLTVNVPERFFNNFEERDTKQKLLVSRDLESLLQQRTFQKASSKYSGHIAMVKNGYRPFDEPRFSKTA